MSAPATTRTASDIGDIGHNGPSTADRIAAFLEDQADRFQRSAAQHRDSHELRVRANAYRVAASDVRARLFEVD